MAIQLSSVYFEVRTCTMFQRWKWVKKLRFLSIFLKVFFSYGLLRPLIREKKVQGLVINWNKYNTNKHKSHIMYISYVAMYSTSFTIFYEFVASITINTTHTGRMVVSALKLSNK